MSCIFVVSSIVSEASVLDGQKIPGASFRKNTVQSSSNLNRIKFITAFLPRQYKRKRRQNFDKFSQLSLCNCKADIYEAGSLIAACVFVQCCQISGSGPSLASLHAFTLCFRKIRLHLFTYPKKVTAQITYLSFAKSPRGPTAACPEGDVHRRGCQPALQPVLACPPRCAELQVYCV